MNKKIFIIFILLLTIIYPSFSFADDYNEEVFSDLILDASTSLNSISVPSISSRNCVVLDRVSKTILYGKNEHQKCKMASTTKIMTAIVVIENCKNLDDIVTISKKSANIGGSRLGLSTNRILNTFK